MPDSGPESTKVPAPDQAVIRLKARLLRSYRARICGDLVRPATEASRLDLPPDLAPGLREALTARGLPQLYSHQREAFDLAQAGRHLVVATPTASGKTLCYNLPVLDAVLRGGKKALYLFPTKALAQDQVAELIELGRALKTAGGEGVRAYTFDGDTPGDARKAVRTRGDIVVRSEERRVGKECLRLCRSRWSPSP